MGMSKRIRLLASAVLAAALITCLLPLQGPVPSAAAPALPDTTISLSGAGIWEGSVAVADFNGDGYKEIVAGGDDGRLYEASYDGANWDVEGDLFIYLDTEIGSGATTLYNPYGDGTTVYLPGNMPDVDVSGWPAFEVARYTQILDLLLAVSIVGGSPGLSRR